MLIDTHCHIHEADYPLKVADVIKNAKSAGVEKIICVGASYDSSKNAVKTANENDDIYATIGIHPYFDDSQFDDLEELIKTSRKIVAIGETGLDYYKNTAPKSQQIRVFEKQIDLAIRHNLPLVFHIREAYDDFWPIIDNFSNVKGVLHSFSGDQKQVEAGLIRGFLFALNGISTFSNLPEYQKDALAMLPTDKIVLETDAPYLTPEPFRGKIRTNEPAYVREIAQFNANVYNMTFEQFADVTSKNAVSLFNLN